MIGEGISSLSEHPDNVAPALLGGLIMVKSVEEENIISLLYLMIYFVLLLTLKLK